MSEDDTNADRLGEHSAFPYVVIRHFPTVYEQQPVQFVKDSRQSETTDGILLIHLPISVEDDPAEANRASLVAGLVDLARTTDKRTCAVFGPEDAIYVEPSGETRASADLPRSEWHWRTA